MNQRSISEDRLSPLRVPIWLIVACAACILIGVAGLAVGFALAPLDAWLWLVINFIIFGGIMNGMLGWAAGFRIAQTRWTPAINRICQSAFAFVPVAAAALVAIAATVGQYAPWAIHPDPKKDLWLNTTGFIIRELVGFAILWTLALLLVRWSLRSDEKVRRGDIISPRDHYRLNAVSTAFAMVFSIVMTIASYDFAMSFMPEFVSTAFGPIFFTTDLYAGMAMIILISALLRRPLGVGQYLKPQQFKDMGNLMLGFGLFLIGLFYAQYLTIWYENLPTESPWLIIRYYHGPWTYVGWASFIICFCAPAVLLQSRGLKQNPRLLAPTAGLALLGYMLERYVLVVPSFYRHKLMLFPPSVLSLLAFSGAFVLATAIFLSRYSPVSAADEALREVPHVEVE